MNNYKLLIQYDGGKYSGWQRLGNDDRTIQGKIEKVLSEMLGRKIEIIGCSRTDADVHAIGQVANFKVNEKLNTNEMKNYLNKYLPQDIAVTKVISMSEDFHARYNAKAKTYLYKIWNEEYSNPFMRKYSMHVPKPLNIEKMKEAANNFIGEHDFTTFTNAKSKKKSMIRKVYSIDFIVEGSFINIRICGNGFLHNMVRKIVGTLIEVGHEKIKSEDIAIILKSKERNQSGILADGCGLYLEKIDY